MPQRVEHRKCIMEYLMDLGVLQESVSLKLLFGLKCFTANSSSCMSSDGHR